MIYKELKNFVKGYIKIITNYKNDDAELTKQEIENLCPLYKENASLISNSNGIKFIDDKLFLFYVDLEKISIELQDNITEISPNGYDNLILKTYGYFNICSKQYGTNLINIEKTVKQEIRGIISMEENDFTKLINYRGNKSLKISQNSFFTERLIFLNASFFLNKKYTTTLKLIQLPNKKEVIESDEIIKDIIINPTRTYFSHHGGTSKLTIQRIITKSYQEKDVCGKIINEYESDEVIQDCTNDCLFIVKNNTEGLILKNNLLTISKQELNAIAREFNVIVKYKNISKSVTFYQEAGSKPNYQTILQLKNDNDLIICNEKKTYTVELLSEKILYIDNKEKTRLVNNNIKISNYPNWLIASIKETFNSINLDITITELNTDKNLNRTGKILIENESGDILNITIEQQPNTVNKALYEVLCDNKYIYTINDLNAVRVPLKGQIIHVYSNGEATKTYLNNIDSDASLNFKYISSNEGFINGGKITSDSFGDDFYFKPNILSNVLRNDVTFTLLVWIENNETQECLSEYKEIKLYFKAIKKSIINVPFVVNIHTTGNEIWTKGSNYINIINDETKEIDSTIELTPVWIPENETSDTLAESVLKLEKDTKYIFKLQNNLIAYPTMREFNDELIYNVKDNSLIEYKINI